MTETQPAGLRPEMGTKMAEKWILALPEKWGKHGPENRENGPKFHFRTILGPFFPFSGPFFSFSGPFSPHFSGEAKIHVSAIFVPISGRRPEMDLYEIHGIPIPDLVLRSRASTSGAIWGGFPCWTNLLGLRPSRLLERGFGPPARNRKNKYRFRPPPEKRKNLAEKKGKSSENCPKIEFWAHFPILRLIFPFSETGQNLYFACFGPEARKTRCSSRRAGSKYLEGGSHFLNSCRNGWELPSA